MSASNFDRPASALASTGRPRLAALDVARAVALVGVVAMNYVGALLTPGRDRGFWGRVFDPYTGVLTTRFAATFVLVAGIGISLLTESARTGDDPTEVTRARLRLARRGLLLYGTGFVLDLTWPGTILFYYGAYFLLAALLLRLATRWLIVIAIGSGVIATTFATWVEWKISRRQPVTWIGFERVESLQDLAVRTFIDYTHPVLPWITFVCAGMVIGRHIDTLTSWRRRVTILASAAVVVVYVTVSVLDSTSSRDGVITGHLTSLRTFDRGLLYLISTLGIAIVGFLAITVIVEKNVHRRLVVHFQRAGQLTLSLYLLHVLVFSMVVNWFGFVDRESLTAALTFAGIYWLVAITAASWWHHRVGRGPAEVVLRVFGG